MAKAKATRFPTQEEADAEEDSPDTVVTVKAPKSFTCWADVGGSENEDFNKIMLNQAATAIFVHPDAETHLATIQAVLAGMVGIGPRDETEGMLAAQMVAVHIAAMECFRRAAIPGQTLDGRDSALRHAAKLTRTYTAQMEALNRYRGKGQQKMTVEHVHVHDGGQAIVGTVNSKGGSEPENASQPHAKSDAITHAPEPAMSCQDPRREPVPVRRDAQRPVSNARR